MYMWREFDGSEVRDELAHVADLGFEVVRVFVLMQDFMPAADVVTPRMVARLVDVALAARDARLRVVPTLIVLNMSGRIWWPHWMLAADARPRDLYADPAMLRAQSLLVESCAGALAGDDAIRAFDLANEIDGALRPSSAADARRWVAQLAQCARRAAPAVPLRIGAHLPSLTTDNDMRIDELAAVLDEDAMHAYPLYSSFARTPLDPELAPFACALTAALGGRGRRALLQEFGACTASPADAGRSITDDFLGEPSTQYLASEPEQAEYYASVLERLSRTGAAGAYAWCYGDYDPGLFGRPPLDRAVRERTFGIVRADGSEKPAAAVLRDFCRRRPGGPHQEEPVPDVLDASADEYYQEPAAHFERLYARWLARYAE